MDMHTSLFHSRRIMEREDRLEAKYLPAAISENIADRYMESIIDMKKVLSSLIV